MSTFAPLPKDRHLYLCQKEQGNKQRLVTIIPFLGVTACIQGGCMETSPKISAFWTKHLFSAWVLVRSTRQKSQTSPTGDETDADTQHSLVCKARFYTKNKAQEHTNLLAVKNNIRPENIIKNKIKSLWHSSLAKEAGTKSTCFLGIPWSGGYFQGYLPLQKTCWGCKVF